MTEFDDGRVRMVWGSSTDRGLKRTLNEDSHLARFPLFLVADGMGGHSAGEVASATALAAFDPLVGRAAVTLDEIATAFATAVAGVQAIEAAEFPPGTTLSGVAVSEHAGETYWLVVNLGDSRTYRLTPTAFEQVSVDHSAVQELVDAGELSSTEVDEHPDRNVITKAIGAGSLAAPDYWLLPAAVGDRVLVCSDGLTRELSTARIELVLREEPVPQIAAMRLVHEALLKGGRDNVTVVVVDAVRLRSPAPDEPEGDDTVPRSFDPSTALGSAALGSTRPLPSPTEAPRASL